MPLVSALFRPAFLASVFAHGAVVVVALVVVRVPEPASRAAVPAWVDFTPSPAESASEPALTAEEPPVLPEVLVELSESAVLPAEAVGAPEDPWQELPEPVPESLLPAVHAPRAPSADARIASRLLPAREVPAPPPALAGAAGRPVERASVQAPPRPLASNRPPAYPYEARAQGAEGVVYFRVTIHADGSVGSASVETTSGHALLDRAAEDALRGWRFAPALVDGVPTATTVRIPVTFRLS